MPVYESEDIAGYQIDEEVICSNCLKAGEEVSEIIEISETETNDKVYICDRCHKQF